MESIGATEALDGLAAAVAAFGSADLTVVDARELLALARDLEVVRRKVDAVTVGVLDVLDRSGAYAEDGYLSAHKAVKRLGRLSPGEAGRRMQLVRALRSLPLVAEAYRNGDVPTGHVQAIGRIAANPRIQHLLAGADEFFTKHASVRAYRSFVGLANQWERLADEDGAEERAARQHERRSASAVQSDFDGSLLFSAMFGALQGAVMKNIFDRFVEAEALADWEAARAEHGPDATAAQLPRTPNQRRADAVFAIFEKAASAPLDGERAEPLVNVVVSWETFQRELAKLAGEDVEPVDPNQADQIRCETIDGAPLAGSDMLEAAINGHVRRVVMGADGVVVDLGRRRRLFTGNARDAVLLGGWAGQPPGCQFQECGIRAARLQNDHLDEWQDGGPTSPANGAGVCARHNRLKSARGFTVVRDETGRLCIYRSDGTPVTEAA